MDRAALEQRLAKLRQKANETMQLAWIYEGAAQECEFWLSQHPDGEPDIETVQASGLRAVGEYEEF